MILQSFNDPVWTVRDVGAVYMIILTVFGWLFYHLIRSLIEIFKPKNKK